MSALALRDDDAGAARLRVGDKDRPSPAWPGMAKKAKPLRAIATVGRQAGDVEPAQGGLKVWRRKQFRQAASMSSAAAGRNIGIAIAQFGEERERLVRRLETRREAEQSARRAR